MACDMVSTMKADSLLQYVGKCGLWFRATAGYETPLTMAQVRDYMAPPLETEQTCKTRMAQWLAYNSETGTLEGAIYPEHVIAALELLRANCRALDFHAINL